MSEYLSNYLTNRGKPTELVNLIKKFIKQSSENAGQDQTRQMEETLQAIAAVGFGNHANAAEIPALFTTLREAMSKHKLWAGLSLLSSAVEDPDIRQLLVHYKFIQVLTNMLINDQSVSDNKIKLMIIIENLSQGIKITFEEPGLAETLKHLSGLILKSPLNLISIMSLSILVNMCNGNRIVIGLLEKTVNLSTLVKCLISKKDSEIGSVQVCRFLVIVQNFKGDINLVGIHNYLEVALRQLAVSIKDVNENELRHIDYLITDLYSDPCTKPHILSYEHYDKYLQEALKLSPGLLSMSHANKKCLQHIFSILRNILKLELYSLRSCHRMIADLCVNACHIQELSGIALRLLGIVVVQYEEDGMLPDDLMPVISMGFHTLLDPSKINPGTEGLDWLRFISSLCDCHATREAVFANVTVEKFEDIFRQTINHFTSNFPVKHLHYQELILTVCHICLSFTTRSKSWEALFHRILSSESVMKVFNGCIGSIQSSNRKQFFRVIRHTDFPVDRLNQIIAESDSFTEISNGVSVGVNGNKPSDMETNFVMNPTQEDAINELINSVSKALSNNDGSNNISVINLMDLYKHKIANLENRLKCSSTSLENANQTVASLNHSIVTLDAINKNHEEVLYQTQCYNKKLENNCNSFANQIADAEKAIKKFQSKLAAERMDKENSFKNIQHDYTARIKDLEEKIESTHRNLTILQEQYGTLEKENQNFAEKLNEQTKKNGELAGVLVKFEDKVRHKDKKLEELTNLNKTFKNELEQSQHTVKGLEKTVLEREQRVSQLTSQLEEMQRVQDIIANLMGSKNVTGSTTSS